MSDLPPGVSALACLKEFCDYTEHAVMPLERRLMFREVARRYDAMLSALNEAAYGLSLAEQYLGKAVADGELAGTTIPVEHALITIEGRHRIVRKAIDKARS